MRVFLFIWKRPSYQASNWRDKGWSFVESLWRTIAPLMRPWCNEGEGPSAVNANLCGDSQSQVQRHSDDEPLFGGIGGTLAGRSSQLWCKWSFSMQTSSVLFALCRRRLAAFPRVTFWAWMGLHKMSSYHPRRNLINCNSWGIKSCNCNCN